MAEQRQPRQFTLLDLLLAIAFFMPVIAAEIVLIRSGAGLVRHLLTVPLGIAIGAAIVWIDWKLGSRLWLRTDRYSHRTQNAMGIALLLGDLLSIFAGAALGTRVGSMMIQNLAK